MKAKGSLSIVTAVNVAEMVKHDVAGLETRSIAIGTDEFVVEGITRRVSFIEICLDRKKPEQPSVSASALAAPKKWRRGKKL